MRQRAKASSMWASDEALRRSIASCIGSISGNIIVFAASFFSVTASAALSEKVRRDSLMDSSLTGEANLLVCPNLDAANILFNVLKMTGGSGVTVGIPDVTNKSHFKGASLLGSVIVIPLSPSNQRS